MYQQRLSHTAYFKGQRMDRLWGVFLISIKTAFSNSSLRSLLLLVEFPNYSCQRNQYLANSNPSKATGDTLQDEHEAMVSVPSNVPRENFQHVTIDLTTVKIR